MNRRCNINEFKRNGKFCSKSSKSKAKTRAKLNTKKEISSKKNLKVEFL